VKLADEAMQQLDRQGSTAGYYLRALRTSGLPSATEVLSVSETVCAKESLAYLRTCYSKISRDARCLDLMLELWWRINVGSKFFSQERLPLKLTPLQYKEALDIIVDLERTGESQRPVVIMYLHAIVLFQLSDVGQSLELFRAVESDSFQMRGRWRIIRSYLASTEEGTPRRFHGNVTWINHDRGKGEVYVEELRRRLGFIPHEFANGEIERGDSLGEFHIAFNLLGPICEPVSSYKHVDDRGRRKE
jgi:hypothetical protein